MKTICLFLLLAFSLPVIGQQPPLIPTPLPSGKLPAAAPAYCQWVVTFQYLPSKPTGSSNTSPTAPKKANANDNRPSKIVVIKTGTVISQVIDTLCGRRSESWLIGHFQLNRTSESKQLVESNDDPANPDYICVQTGDFSEFSWIGPGNYLGAQEWQGRMILVFRNDTPGVTSKPLSDPQVENSPSVPASATSQLALIDADSRLPALLQIGTETQIYEFTPLPKVVQPLPDEVKAHIDERKERIRKMLTPPARPF